jgi:uncharacterized membrane-anchored protein YhcB (DUF1043 family)
MRAAFLMSKTTREMWWMFCMLAVAGAVIFGSIALHKNWQARQHELEKFQGEVDAQQAEFNRRFSALQPPKL